MRRVNCHLRKAYKVKLNLYLSLQRYITKALDITDKSVHMSLVAVNE